MYSLNPRHYEICFTENRYSIARALSGAFSLGANTSRTPACRQFFSSTLNFESNPTSNNLLHLSARRRHLPRKRAAETQRIRPNFKNIIIDDLQATLEAHRTANRASIIRNVKSDTPSSSPILRPHVEYVSRRESEPNSESDESRHISSEGDLSTENDDVETSMNASHSTCNPKEASPEEPLEAEMNIMAGMGDGDIKFFKNPSYEGPVITFSEKVLCPWISPYMSKAGDASSRLSSEILSFAEYVSLTQDEYVALERVQERFASYTVNTLSPSFDLQLVGSHETGLATPFSDLNLKLVLPHLEKDPFTRGPRANNPETQAVAKKKLKIIYNILRSKPQLYSNTFYLGDISIPIVNTIEKASGVAVQIQASGDTRTPIEYAKTYLQELPLLRPLYLVLKAILIRHGLGHTGNGAPASYTLLMMIVASLKLNHSLSVDAASELLAFLKLYGYMDTYRFGIAADPPCFFPKHRHKAEISVREKERALEDPILFGQHRIARITRVNPLKFCIQDPANPQRDLGTGITKTPELQARFRRMRHELKLAIKTYAIDEGPYADVLRTGKKSFLEILLGSNWAEFERRREKLLYGRPPGEGVLNYQRKHKPKFTTRIQSRHTKKAKITSTKKVTRHPIQI